MKRNIRYFLMIVGLMLSVGIFAQTTKWRDIYTVKKKDTIFGIANKYGLSLPELMEANPEMKQEGYMLQKGTTLFIPFASDQQNPNAPKKAQKEDKNAVAASKPAVAGTAAAQQKVAASDAVKIGVMLPLHDVDGDGKRMVEYYRGLLMACNYLKKKGISTDVMHGMCRLMQISAPPCCRRVPIRVISSLVRFIPSRWLRLPASARPMASSS